MGRTVRCGTGYDRCELCCLDASVTGEESVCCNIYKRGTGRIWPTAVERERMFGAHCYERSRAGL